VRSGTVAFWGRGPTREKAISNLSGRKPAFEEGGKGRKNLSAGRIDPGTGRRQKIHRHRKNRLGKKLFGGRHGALVQRRGDCAK